MAITVLPGSPVLGAVDKIIWRGSNRPRPIWPFGMNLAGSTMVLAVAWRGGGFSCSSDPSDPGAALYGGLDLIRLKDVDPTAEAPEDDPLFRDTVRWNFSLAAAALIPLGRIAEYRLRREVRGKPSGEVRLYREGYFLGRSA